MLLALAVLPSFALTALGAAMQPELLVGPGGQMELENVPEYILSALVEDVTAIPSIAPTTTDIATLAEPTNGFIIPPAAGVDAPTLTLVPSGQGRLAMADPQPDDVVTNPEDITTSATDILSSTDSSVASSTDDVQSTATPTVTVSTQVPSPATTSDAVADTTSETDVMDTTSATSTVPTAELTSAVTPTEADTSLLSTSTTVDSVTESSRTTTVASITSTTTTASSVTHTPKKHTVIDSESLVTTHYISRTVTQSTESSSPTVKLDAATPQQKATQRTVRAVLIVLAIFFGTFLIFFLLRKRICRPCCGSDEEDDMWVAPPMAHTHVPGVSQMGLDAAVDKHRESIHVQQLASCTPQLTSIPRVNYERHGGAGQRVHLPPVPGAAPENPFEPPAHRFSPGYARPTSMRITPTEYSPSTMPRFGEPQASPALAPRKLYGLGYTNIGLGVGEVWQGRYATRDY